MHRLIAILLIPIFVVGNSFAHSHGSAAHSPASHQWAHIHVGGNDHHEHGHAAHSHDHVHKHHDEHHSHEDEHGSNGAQQEPIAPPVDHDSDAIYLVASDFATTSTGRVSMELDSHLALPQFDASFVDSPAKILSPQPHKSPPFELPLYLLHAALRL